MASTTTSRDEKIDSESFYNEYYGHPLRDLQILLPKLREQVGNEGILLWTAGDSSLDNKHWFRSIKPAVEGAYRDLLQPSRSNADVTYWLNYLLHERGVANDDGGRGNFRRMAAINTAVEATTINERTFQLRSQDMLIRDNIQAEDILIVSIGGNDVALAPAPCTIASVVGVIHCCPASVVDQGCAPYSCPMDDRCCGCGPSLLSCFCAFPPCLGYLKHLFGTRVQHYVDRITSKNRPKKIFICMIYYPDEQPTPSWAGLALSALGYNSRPEKLQLMIRRMFTDAISTMQIPGSEVIPVPLFHALDGKESSDYVARVEPSPRGGRKMAEFILDMIERGESSGNSNKSGTRGMKSNLLSDAPQTTYMEGRG